MEPIDQAQLYEYTWRASPHDSRLQSRRLSRAAWLYRCARSPARQVVVAHRDASELLSVGRSVRRIGRTPDFCKRSAGASAVSPLGVLGCGVVGMVWVFPGGELSRISIGCRLWGSPMARMMFDQPDVDPKRLGVVGTGRWATHAQRCWTSAHMRTHVPLHAGRIRCWPCGHKN